LTCLSTVTGIVIVMQLAHAHLAFAIPDVTLMHHRVRCELWRIISLNIIGRITEIQD